MYLIKGTLLRSSFVLGYISWWQVIDMIKRRPGTFCEAKACHCYPCFQNHLFRTIKLTNKRWHQPKPNLTTYMHGGIKLNWPIAVYKLYECQPLKSWQNQLQQRLTNNFSLACTAMVTSTRVVKLSLWLTALPSRTTMNRFIPQKYPIIFYQLSIHFFIYYSFHDCM